MAIPPPAHGDDIQVNSSDGGGGSRSPGVDEKAVASEAAMGKESDLVISRDDSDADDDSADEKKAQRQAQNRSPPSALPLGRTVTSATDASAALSVGAAGAKIVEAVEREWAARPWYRKLNPLRWGAVPPVPEEREPCPEARAGFLSRVLFSWQGSLMQTGYRRPLQATDVWSVSPPRAVEPTSDRLREAFRRRVAKARSEAEAGGKKGGEGGVSQAKPLLWALHETFFWEFWIGGILGLCSMLFQVFSPFLLRYLIQFATDAYVAQMRGTSGPNIGNGIGLVIGITAMQVGQSLCMNHFIYRGMIVGGQSRAALIGLIYEKSMVLSGRARAGGAEAEGGTAAADATKAGKKKGAAPGADEGSGWGNGRIVNLMSVDTYRIDQASGLFHTIWTSPVACVITLVLLLINISYSALAGFGLLLLGVPIITRAMKSLFARRKTINRITDQRVSLTQEILSAVRFVKFFGWEASFIRRLEQLRAKEISLIQGLLALRNAILAVSLSLPIFASMLSFITFSATNHGLNPAEIFSSLALFNGLRMPLNLLPMVLGQITDAWSSIRRIEEFLLAEEQAEDVVRRPDGESAVEMHGATFTWERSSKESNKAEAGKETGVGSDGKGKSNNKKNQKQQQSHPSSEGVTSSGDEKEGANTPAATDDASREPFKLKDLNFAIGRRELVAVIGTVGSGKSSLLAALAGDMRKTDGEVVLGASRALCPQYAWIQNATVRDNILFGKEMDQAWYQEVIHACALQPDLEMLPNSDLTEIGERGITISGGQRQRLNIARAIYFDADMVLMDDPLSAVDAHVGRHIFDKAIMGLLKDKCRILATHQLWVLNRCDRIVWMEGGRIQAVGTFDELMGDHAAFRQLMESHALEEKKEVASGGKSSKNKKSKTAAGIDGNKDGGISTGDEEEDEEGDEEGPKEKPKPTKLKKGRALMQTEEQAVASVPWSVYGDYIRASGTVLNLPLILLLIVLAQGSNIVCSLWLSYWTSDRFALSTGVYMGVYAGLGAAQVALTFSFMLALSILGTRASRVMLHRAMARVLRAPMAFFDTTPLGRITNRFSRDVDVMDNNLSDAMRMYFFSVSAILSVFALIIAFYPYFAAALAPLIVAFLLATAYYRSSAREVKRFESTLRSTVFAKFGEALSGVACIRAYGLRDRFVAELRRAIDDMDSAYYLTFSNQRWLAIRLDMIGNTLVLVTGILIVTSRFSVNPSTGGLVLSYILGVVQMLQFTVRQLAEVENGMNAVERLRHYGRELEEEAPLHTIDVAPSWPERGEIVFEGVEMRYRAGLPLVLRGLDMHVRGGERIGIVGRTGAGKSSIMSTLFRLVELSGGRITVDGLDIATLGLGDLRSRLAIIPQDPTLFRGTVRSNLDPFNEHSDLELWDALRQADLVGPDTGAAGADSGDENPTRHAAAAATTGGDEKPTITEKSGGGSSATNTGQQQQQRIHLDSAVEEDGLNFSLGQRQLMALARALVRGSRIIVCDEATSSVDMETDAKIQATMARSFRGKTLLCIAHRLRTIVGYDRICVMDQGRIAEMDDPLVLFRTGGIFRAMCERSGIREEDIVNARRSLGLGTTAEEDTTA